MVPFFEEVKVMEIDFVTLGFGQIVQHPSNELFLIRLGNRLWASCKILIISKFEQIFPLAKVREHTAGLTDLIIEVPCSRVV